MASTGSVPKGNHYLDSCVFLNLVFSWQQDSSAAKEFIRKFKDTARTGIVTRWTIMEIITILRTFYAQKNKTDPVIIESNVDSVLRRIFRLPGIKLLTLTPLDLGSLGLFPPDIWNFFQNSLDHLRNFDYKVESITESDGTKKNVINGIGGADSLHVYLAEVCGCDYISTFDGDFSEDINPVPIYNIREKKVY